MKLCYFLAATVLAKKSKPPQSDEARKAWKEIKEPSEAMEKMYRDEMVDYGKNDWDVFAENFVKWVGKMEKEFKTKVAKCGDNFWDNPMTVNDRKRREVVSDAVDDGDEETVEGRKKGKGKGKKKKKNKGKGKEKGKAKGDSDDAPANETPNGDGLIKMNEWCDRFNGYAKALVAWTETHMVECCFMVQKKDKSGQINKVKHCSKAGDKYVKKWKKMTAKFAQGARNQEAGAQCTETWEPTF